MSLHNTHIAFEGRAVILKISSLFTKKTTLSCFLKERIEAYLIWKYRFSRCYSYNRDFIETTRIGYSDWWCFLSFFMTHQYRINMIWDNSFTDVQSRPNGVRTQNIRSWIQLYSVHRHWRVIIYVCDSFVEDLFGFGRRQHCADVELPWRKTWASVKRNDKNKQGELKLNSRESHLVGELS